MRHNAEATRHNMEARMKEREKELKLDLAQAMDAAKDAERVMLEARTRAQQEVMAARAEQNRLQGLLEKLELEKAKWQDSQKELSSKVASADDVIKKHSSALADLEKKQAAVQGEKQALSIEMEKKDQQIHATEVEMKKIRQENDAHSQANNELRAQVMDKDLELESCRAERDVALQKLLQMENQLMDLQKQKKKAEECVKQVSSDFALSTAEKEKQAAIIKEQSVQLEKLQSDVSTFTSKISSLESCLKEKEDLFKDSQKKWNEIESQLKNSLSENEKILCELGDSNSALEKKMACKENALLEMTNKCEASNKQANIKETEIMEKDKEIAHLMRELESLSKQHESLTGDYNCQVNDLKAKLDNAESIIREKIEETEKLQMSVAEEKEGIRKELSECMQAKNNLEEEIKSCNLKLEQGQCLISDLESRVQALKEELNLTNKSVSEKDLQIELSKRELTEKQHGLEELQLKYSQREEHVVEIQIKCSSAEEKVKEVSLQMNELLKTKEWLESENTKYVAEIDELKQQSEHQLQQQVTSKAECEQLKIQLNATERECENLQETIKTDAKENLLMKEEVEKLNCTCRSFEQTINNLQSQLNHISEEKTVVEKSCSNLSEQLEILKVQNKNCSDTIESLNSLKAEADTAHQLEIQTLSHKLEEALEELSRRSSESENLVISVNQLKEEAVSFNNYRSDMETKQLALKEELDSKEKAYEQLQTKDALLSEELDALKEMITEKNCSLQSLTCNLDQLAEKLKDIEAQKTYIESNLGSQLEDLNHKLSCAQEAEGCALTQVKELTSHCEDLQTKLAQAELAKSEADEVHEQESEVLRSQLDMVQMDIEDKDGKILSLASELENKKASLEKLQTECTTVSQASEDARAEVLRLTAKLESCAETSSETEQQAKDLQERVLNLESSLSESLQNCEEKEKAVNAMVAKCEEIEAALSEKDFSLNKLQEGEKILTNQIKDLQGLVDSERELVHSKNSELNALNSQHIAMSSELNEVQSLLMSLQDSMSSKTESLQCMESRIKELESENSAMRNNFIEEKKDTLQKLDAAQEEAKEKSSRLLEVKGLLDDLKQEMDEIKMQRQKQESKNHQERSALQSKYDILQMDIEDKDEVIQSYADQLENLKATLANVTKEKDEFKASVERSSETLAKLTDDLDKLNQELEEKASKIEELETISKQYQSEIDESNSKLSEVSLQHQQNVEVLKSDLDMLQKNMNDKDAIIHNLEDQTTHLQSQLEHVTKEKDNLKEVLQSDAEELEKVTAKLDELQTELERKKSEVEKLESDVSSLQVQFEESTQQASKLANLNEQECGILKSKMDLLQMDLEDKEDLIQSQVKELAEIKQQLENETKEKDVAQNALEHGKEELASMLDKMNILQKAADETLEQNDELNKNINNLQQEVGDLKRQASEDLAQNEQKTDALNAKLEMAQMDLEDKEKNIQNFQNQINNIQQELEDANKKNNETNQALFIKTNEILELQNALDLKKEEEAKAKAEFSQVSNEIKILENCLTQTKGMVAEKEQANRQLEEGLEAKHTENQRISKIMEQLEADKEILASKVQDLEGSLSSQSQSIEEKIVELVELRQNCASLSEQVDLLQQEISNLKEGKAALTQNHCSLEKELKICQEEIQHLKENDAYQRAGHAEALNQLQKDLETKTCKIIELQDSEDDLKQRLADAKERELEISHHDHEMGILKSKLDMLQMDLEDKESSVQTLTGKVTNLQNELETATQESDEATKVLESNQAEMSKLADELNSAQKECEIKSNNLKELKIMFDRVNNELEDVQTQRSEEASQFEQECGILKSKLDVLQMDLESKEDIINNCNHQISNLQDQINGLTREKVEYMDLAEISEKNLLKMTDSLNDVSKQLEEKLLKMKELEDEVNSLQNKIVGLEKENMDLSAHSEQETGALKSKLELLQMDLEDKEGTIQTLNEQVFGFQTKVESVTKQRDDTRTLLDTAEKDLAHMSEKNTSLEKEKQEKSTRVVELESQTESLKCKLSGILQEKVEQESELGEETGLLQAKLDKIQMDYDEQVLIAQALQTRLSNTEIDLIGLKQARDQALHASQNWEFELSEMSVKLEIEKEESAQQMAELTKLRDKVRDLEDALATAKDSIQESEKRLQQTQRELEEAQQIRAAEAGNLKGIQMENERLVSRVTVLHDSLSSERELVIAKTAEVEELKEKCLKFSEEKEELEKEISKGQAELESQSRSIGELSKKLQYLENERKYLQDKKDQEITNALENLSVLKTECEDKSNTVLKLQDTTRDLENKLEVLKAERSDYVTKFDKERVSLNSKIEILEAKLEEREKIILDLNSQLNSIKSLLEAGNQEKEALQDNAKVAEEKMLELQSLCDSVSQHRDKLLKEVQTVAMKSTEFESVIKNQKSELDEKQCCIDILEQKVATNTKELELVKCDLGKKNSEAKVCKERLQMMESNLSEITTSSHTPETSKPYSLDESKELSHSEEELQRKAESEAHAAHALKQDLGKQEKVFSERVRTLEQEVESLRLQHLQAADEITLKASELKSMQVQYENMNTCVVNANSKLNDLKVEKKKVSDQLEELQRQHNNAQEELREKNDNLNILREELDSATQENEALRTDKFDWLNKEESYKLDIQGLHMKLSDYEHELESTRDSFEMISDERFEAQRRMNQALRDKEAMELKQKELETELRASLAQDANNLDLEQSLKESKQKLLAAEQEIFDLKKELDSISQQSKLHDVQESGNLKQHVAEMEEESKQRIEMLERKLTSKEEEACYLRSQLDQTLQTKKSGGQDVAVLQNEITELRRSLEETKLKNIDLEEKLQSFAVETEEIKDQLVLLQTHINQLNSSLDAKKREVVTRVNQLATINEELDAVKAQLHTSQKALEEANNDISKLKKDIKDAKSTTGTLEDAIESLNFDLAEAEKERDSLLSDNSSLKNEISVLENKLKMVTEDLNIAKCSQSSRDGDLQITIQDLMKKHDEAILTICSLQSENAEWNTQVMDYKKRLEEVKEEVDRVKEALSDKLSENKALLLKIESTETELSLKAKQLETKVQELDKLEDIESTLSVEVAESKHLVEKLQRNLDLKVSEIAQLEITYNEMKQELKDTNEELEVRKRDIIEKDQELTGLKNAKLEQEMSKDRICLERDKMEEELKQLRSLKTAKLKIESDFEKLKVTLKDKEEAHMIEQDIWQEKISHLEASKEELEKAFTALRNILGLQEGDAKQCDLEERLLSMIEKEIGSKKKMSELEKDNIKTKQDLQEAVSDMTLLNKKVEELSLALTESQNSLVEKVSQLEAAVIQEAEVKDRLKALECTTASVNDLEDTLDKLRKENTCLKQELKSIQESGENTGKQKQILRKWEERCLELKNQLTMERKKLKSLEEQSKKFEEADQGRNEAASKALQSELASVTDERNSLKEECDKLHAAFKKKIDRTKELEKQLHSTSRLLVMKQNKEKTAEDTLDKLKKENICLKEELKAMQEPGKNTDKDQKALQSELASVTDERDSLREECDKLHAAFKKKIDSTKELEKQLHSTSRLLVMKQNKEKTAEDALDKLKKENICLKEKLKAIQESETTADKEQEALKSELASVTDERDSLREECDKLHAAFKKKIDTTIELEKQLHSTSKLLVMKHKKEKMAGTAAIPDPEETLDKLQEENACLKSKAVQELGKSAEKEQETVNPAYIGTQSSLSASLGCRMTRSRSAVLDSTFASPGDHSASEQQHHRSSPTLLHQPKNVKISPRVTRRMSLNKRKSAVDLTSNLEDTKKSRPAAVIPEATSLSNQQLPPQRHIAKDTLSSSGYSAPRNNLECNNYSTSALATITNSPKKKAVTSAEGSKNLKRFSPRGFSRSRMKSATPNEETNLPVAEDDPSQCATQ
ncbi:hypothetical protein PoB_003971700 [Plakobranchus ocellatus]|uniref:Uncharacterized protein n=1 Tax=Plakobranchus ocellatus TaxID=259542 RepID=A0AAV4B1W0_9GAST|nr:hypothetical protein PoB_003971700 [Plakobranchus ocellatus]